ncbi:MAG TPA: P1 family peptidase [Fimbriimonas sp.]|nr:P1 family peptidase [Fimbriimonas sp.]
MARARDLGIALDGEPGALNAITDVPGVEVGHCTLIEGDSVRTGVTAIHPRGRRNHEPVFAGWFSLNGNGEMTGTAWIDESGVLSCPVVLTNTHSVGVAHQSVIQWMRRENVANPWLLPVVAETWDGLLNDIDGFHVRADHVFQALDLAKPGPVDEGNVGGGTGMICFGYKGGIGTASRRVGGNSVGALVQANHGSKHQLRLGGVQLSQPSGLPDRGSIIVVLGTDAPMLPHQLKALAKRAALGLGRTGAVAALSSGDLFLAFSSGNPLEARAQDFPVTALGEERCTPVYEAAVQATEEAILNALVAAKTLSGKGGFTVDAISHEAIREATRRRP